MKDKRVWYFSGSTAPLLATVKGETRLGYIVVHDDGRERQAISDYLYEYPAEIERLRGAMEDHAADLMRWASEIEPGEAEPEAESDRIVAQIFKDAASGKAAAVDILKQTLIVKTAMAA